MNITRRREITISAKAQQIEMLGQSRPHTNRDDDDENHQPMMGPVDKSLEKRVRVLGWFRFAG